MTISSVKRKESGSQTIMVVINGNQNKQQTGETVCWPGSSERGETMEKETYKEIEKIADNLQAAAGRKKCREIERANSFYEGYEQGIEDMLRSIRQEGRK